MTCAIPFFIFHSSIVSKWCWGQKPQLWCLRIVPCVALPQSSQLFAYRGIVIPLLGSYWGGSQGLSSTYEQAHVDLDLLTLASYIIHNDQVKMSLLSLWQGAWTPTDMHKDIVVCASRSASVSRGYTSCHRWSGSPYRKAAHEFDDGVQYLTWFLAGWSRQELRKQYQQKM